ncbi:hypothetical protein [Ruminiclostridium cellulolyticum]|uniref:hypothetical protein n=1 Tax=Ruminiclostridium cellulolyticum TaxID=1521 RepID=UPI0002FB27A8|nr:hypothetical protein [Ruminiclostridium cellulolyticum]
MSQEDFKNKTNEQTVEQSVAKDSTNKENDGCTGDCSCKLFSYKRPTEDDAKKSKRKTCC